MYDASGQKYRSIIYTNIALGVAEKYTTFSKNQQYKILNFWGK